MKVCIFGGNGFVGSAVARKAVARGWSVVSVSRSGTPFATPAGHSPAWVNEVRSATSSRRLPRQRLTAPYGQVDWRKGSPFDPSTYDAVLPECDALVTTLGTLFETSYKDKGVARPFSVLKALAENLSGSRGNPLAQEARERSYERLNRDSGAHLPLAPYHCEVFSLTPSRRPSSPATLRLVPLVSLFPLFSGRPLPLRLHLGRRHFPPVRALSVHPDQATGRGRDLATRRCRDRDAERAACLCPPECVSPRPQLGHVFGFPPR